MFTQTLHVLLGRRQQPGRILFLAAALPLILTALFGWEYGAFPPYAILASICLLQAAYPTLLGWAVVVGVYSVGSAVYLYGLARDLVEKGGDADDTMIGVILLVLLGIEIALLRHRPKPA